MAHKWFNYKQVLRRSRELKDLACEAAVKMLASFTKCILEG